MYNRTKEMQILQIYDLYLGREHHDVVIHQMTISRYQIVVAVAAVVGNVLGAD
jgi:hypothetical protein